MISVSICSDCTASQQSTTSSSQNLNPQSTLSHSIPPQLASGDASPTLAPFSSLAAARLLPFTQVSTAVGLTRSMTSCPQQVSPPRDKVHHPSLVGHQVHPSFFNPYVLCFSCGPAYVSWRWQKEIALARAHRWGRATPTHRARSRSARLGQNGPDAAHMTSFGLFTYSKN